MADTAPLERIVNPRPSPSDLWWEYVHQADPAVWKRYDGCCNCRGCHEFREGFRTWKKENGHEG